MEFGLGRFGDRRLEKGGPFCIGGLSRWGSEAWQSARLAAAERGRCGSRASCATTG